jgi:peptide/nickel transport system substrate-binding protein
MATTRRTFLINTARIAGGLAIASCAPGATPGPAASAAPVAKDLVVVASQEITDGQPYNQAAGDIYGRVHSALYDTVIRRDENSKLAPGIATSWTVLNPTTWQLKLRQGVKFHNGDPLTAADVKWSIEHTVDPAAKTLDRATFASVARIDVLDDFTLNIVTKDSDPFIPGKLSVRPSYVMPSKHFQAVGVDAMNASPVGSGPYMFKERAVGAFKMVRNPNYWRGTPDADSITIIHRPDETSRVAALKTGEANFLTTLSYDQIEPLNAYATTKTVKVPTISIDHYIVNTTVKPLNDKRIRQALSLAIDRPLLNRTLGRGLYDIANGPIASFEFGYDASLPPLAYDPSKAKQLMQQAGYANEKITVESRPADRNQDQAIAELWKAVGFNIEIVPMDDATRARKQASLGFLGLAWGATASRLFDPNSVVWRALQPGGTRRYWSDPEFDKLGFEQASSTDDAVRLRNWRRMTEMMLDHMPLIYLWVAPDIVGLSKKVDFIPTKDANDDFGPGHLKFSA